MLKNYITDLIKFHFGHVPTNEQNHVIDSFAEFLLSDTPCLVLTGYAGTGKTSIVSAVVGALREMEQKCVLLAPTGRAAKVLSTYAHHPAFTIHKYIYLYNLRKDTDIPCGRLSPNKAKDTLYIVDEASMIDMGVGGDVNVLQDLIEYVFSKPMARNKLMLIGDTAQLPPVGEQESPALTEEVLEAMGLDVCKANLTEVVRQEKKSYILANATRLREKINDEDFSPFSPVFKKDVENIMGNELIDAISDCYDTDGIEQTAIICRSNKRANIYNNGVRARILDYEDVLECGEIIMIAKNNYYWLENENSFIANGDIAIVDRMWEEEERYGFHFADVSVVFPDYSEEEEFEVKVLLDTLQSESPSLTREQNEKLFQNIMEDYMHIKNWRKRMAAMREDPYFNALQIKYAYAVTCHKAQGGQWKNVFVDQGFVNSYMMQEKNYWRWLYTAFTRGVNKLMLVNWPTQLSTWVLVMALCLISNKNLSAQNNRLIKDCDYMVEMNAVTSNGEEAPFWISAGKYGLSSIQPNSGYLRMQLTRDSKNDSTRLWKVGYGLDLAVPMQYTSKFVVQQAYGLLQYKNTRLTIGAKETPAEMLNDELSSGGATLSNNYRPIPQVRIDLPNWWVWHFTNDWVRVKGHLSYGMTTDWNWTDDFVTADTKKHQYTRHALFHNKAGYLQVGKQEVFPLTGTIGLEMAAQFGGYGFNLSDRTDEDNKAIPNNYNLGNGLKNFWNAFFFGGADVNDGDYSNVEGNQAGNWYFDVMYHGHGWSAKAYAEHFFEDHSQLFVQYGWRDMLWGIECELPKNPFVDKVVAEYLKTDDQASGVYHDKNNVLPYQISGKDSYYNNHIYGAWQHWGQAMGNPLLLSPIYNNDGVLTFKYNRVRALHLAIAGNPTEEISYRLKYSHLKTWGTYDLPTRDIMYQNYLLAELSYKPQNKTLRGWSITGAWGMNTGELLSKSMGISLSVRKIGKLF